MPMAVIEVSSVFVDRPVRTFLNAGAPEENPAALDSDRNLVLKEALREMQSFDGHRKRIRSPWMGAGMFF